MARLARRQRWVDALWLSLVNACGLWVHYFFAFLVVAEFIYVTAILRRNRQGLYAFYLCFLLCLLLFAPWVGRVIVQGYNYHLVEWIMGYPGVTDKLIDLFVGPGRFIALMGAPQPALSLFAFLFPTLLLVYLVGRASRALMRSHRGSLASCLVFIGVPLVGMLFFDIATHGAFLRQERFWVFIFVGCAPLIGYALRMLLTTQKAIGVTLILTLATLSWFTPQVQFGPAPQAASTWIGDASSGRKAAVLVYNYRSVLLAQAYYLPSDTMLLPVINEQQFGHAQKEARGLADIIFVVRHYHRSGALLMDSTFMAYDLQGQGLCLQDAFHEDDISVVEYVRCAS
jgi:hypothetical protein